MHIPAWIVDRWSRRTPSTYLALAALVLLLSTVFLALYTGWAGHQWQLLGNIPIDRCAAYTSDIVRIDRIGQLLIWVAYSWIPLTGICLMRKTGWHDDYMSAILLVSVFIACGNGHLLYLLSTYYYGLVAAYSWETLFTGIVSLLAAYMFHLAVSNLSRTSHDNGERGFACRALTYAHGGIVLLVSLTAFLILGIMAYASVNTSITASAERKVGFDALLRLERLLRLMTEAEGSHRGYVITGNPEYLILYRQAQSDLVPIWRSLDATVSFHTPRLVLLRRLVDEKFAEMAASVALVKQGQSAEAREWVKTDVGLNLMLAIRTETDNLRVHETKRVDALHERAISAGSFTLLLLPFAGGINFMLMLGTIYMMKINEQQKDRAIADREVAWAERERVWVDKLRAEAGVERGKREFQKLVDSVSGYAIFMLDPNGLIVTWNKGAKEIKGYEANEVIGKHFSIFYSQDQIDANWPQIELDNATRDGYMYDEGWRLRQDGSRLWANVVITALRDENGLLYGFLKIARDLTERREHEEALRKAESFFRIIIELAPNAVVVIGADGIIRIWNSAAMCTFGYSAEEAIGLPITGLMPERFREDHVRGIARVIASGKMPLARHPLELAGLRNDGTEFPLEVTLDGVHYEGEWVFFAVLRDTSKTREAEHALRGLNQQLRLVNAELVRSNAELDQFAAVASHDLKSPLRQIVSYVQLLRRRYKDKLDDDGNQFIQYVVDATIRMQELINDLLTFAQAGSGGFTPKTVAMERVIELALRNLNGWLADAHAHIHRQPGMPDVWGDEGQLVQVFQNIINNAVKFSQDRPQVWIGWRPHGKGWEVSVRDNGIGIAQDHLDQIWVMFKRLNGADYPGTGIGLAIVKKIVDRHDGTIRVESVPGEGSTFFVTLPAVPT